MLYEVITLQVVAGNWLALVRLGSEALAGGVAEADGKLGTGTEPDTREFRLALQLEHGAVEHLPEIVVGARVCDVGIGGLDPLDVGVGIVASKRLAAPSYNFV